MLYEEPGPLLTKAGQLLASGEVDDHVIDQLRNIGVQLKRLGAMWPDFFVTLANEITVLRQACESIAAAVAPHDREAATALEVGDDPGDPVRVYGLLTQRLNAVLPVLHANRHTDWGGRALRIARETVAEAGRIQAAMVDKAWNA